MPRSKNSVASRARRKKVLKEARGYWGAKSRLFRSAKESIDQAGLYSYIGRRQKKRNFRRLWILRINAAVRQHGLSYGRFINGLQKVNVQMNRKVLADLAVNDPNSFKSLVDLVKSNSK